MEPEEEDYEELDFQRKAGIADEDYCKAQSQVEEVKPEALYSMVTKSPKAICATDIQPEERLPVSGRSDSDHSVEPEPEIRESAQLPQEPQLRETKPEVATGVPEVTPESPIMWEYKLPAPPPAFKDVVTGHSSTAPEDTTSDSASVNDTDSSISIDSLQVDMDYKPEVQQQATETKPEVVLDHQQQVESVKVDPKPEVITEEYKPELVVLECKPEVVEEVVTLDRPPEVEVDHNPEVVEKESKREVIEKEFQPEVEKDSVMMTFKPQRSILNEFVEVGSIVVDCKPEVVVEAIQHPVLPESLTLNEGSDLQGETTTEEEKPEAEASLPPCSPPPGGDGEEEGLDWPPEFPEAVKPEVEPEMRFSISTYHRRVKKELSYDRKLNRSDSFSATSTTTPQSKSRTLPSTGSLDDYKPEVNADTPPPLQAAQSLLPVSPLPNKGEILYYSKNVIQINYLFN